VSAPEDTWTPADLEAALRMLPPDIEQLVRAALLATQDEIARATALLDGTRVMRLRENGRPTIQ
jgi:hypothetical protein